MPAKSTAKIPALPTPQEYRRARLALKHTQASLAAAIGMSLRTIKHRESTAGNITREMMLALQSVTPREK